MSVNKAFEREREMATRVGRGMMARTLSRERVMVGAHSLWLLQGSPYVSGHFLCHVCWQKGSGPLFHCADCQLDFHVACVGSGHVAQSHFSHFQHPLLLKSSLNSGDQVLCDGCGENHCGTNSCVFRCNQCDFDLCPLCVRAPQFLLHISHPHILVLSTLDELGSSCQCDGCGQSAKGMMYRCTYCNFDLHMSCTRLPLKPILTIHPDHPLTLIFQDDDIWQSSYTCNACGLEGRGWSYTCSICRFYLHPDCGKVYHEVPHTSNSNNGLGHLRNVEHKVPQRAKFLQKTYNNLHNPHSPIINSPSPILTYNSSNNFLNRSYSPSNSFNDPFSPQPYNSHTYSNTSLDRLRNNYSSPRDHGEMWNASTISSNAIAQAISNRITPMSPRDVDAMDRVIGLLKHNGSPPY